MPREKEFLWDQVSLEVKSKFKVLHERLKPFKALGCIARHEALTTAKSILVKGIKYANI